MPNDRRLIEDFLPIQTMGTEASREQSARKPINKRLMR